MPLKMKKYGCKNKKGLVTPEAKRRYEEFILNVQRRIQADNADSNVTPSRFAVELLVREPPCVSCTLKIVSIDHKVSIN